MILPHRPEYLTHRDAFPPLYLRIEIQKPPRQRLRRTASDRGLSDAGKADQHEVRQYRPNVRSWH